MELNNGIRVCNLQMCAHMTIWLQIQIEVTVTQTIAYYLLIWRPTIIGYKDATCLQLTLQANHYWYYIISTYDQCDSIFTSLSMYRVFLESPIFFNVFQILENNS